MSYMKVWISAYHFQLNIPYACCTLRQQKLEIHKELYCTLILHLMEKMKPLANNLVNGQQFP